jgi:hypothetical protein
MLMVRGRCVELQQQLRKNRLLGAMISSDPGVQNGLRSNTSHLLGLWAARQRYVTNALADCGGRAPERNE